MMREAYLNLDLPKLCEVILDKFISYTWVDGSMLRNTQAKMVYDTLSSNSDLSTHINYVWHFNCSSNDWHNFFTQVWDSNISPKKKGFKWLFNLHRLPIKNNQNDIDVRNICRFTETTMHIFFDCIFTHNHNKTMLYTL